jgi:hypothetical protein
MTEKGRRIQPNQGDAKDLNVTQTALLSFAKVLSAGHGFAALFAAAAMAETAAKWCRIALHTDDFGCPDDPAYGGRSDEASKGGSLGARGTRLTPFGGPNNGLSSPRFPANPKREASGLAIRRGKRKRLIHSEGSCEELCDLNAGPGEAFNLVARRKDSVESTSSRRSNPSGISPIKKSISP